MFAAVRLLLLDIKSAEYVCEALGGSEVFAAVRPLLFEVVEVLDIVELFDISTAAVNSFVSLLSLSLPPLSDS